MNTRLTVPHPERVQNLGGVFVPPDTPEGTPVSDVLVVHATLEIGVQLSDTDHRGLKMMPLHEIYIDVNGQEIRVLPHVAREIAHRLVAMCSDAEALDAYLRKS